MSAYQTCTLPCCKRLAQALLSKTSELGVSSRLNVTAAPSLGPGPLRRDGASFRGIPSLA